MILECGGETFRAEETAERICAAGGCPGVDVLALPTGIFLSLDDGERSHSSVGRAKRRDNDLGALTKLNALARAYAEGELELEELASSVSFLEKSRSGALLYEAGWSAAATGAFALLFGGGAFELAVGAAAGFASALLSNVFRKTNLRHFLTSFAGGTVITLIAVLSCLLYPAGETAPIIVGAIMPLLPGLALVNAIRDLMTGDIVSGAARLTDALMTAVAIAGGVGTVLALAVSIGGVTL